MQKTSIVMAGKILKYTFTKLNFNSKNIIFINTKYTFCVSKDWRY